MKFLRGVVVTCEGLPQRDNETIYGLSLALGGQYRVGMTNDVTHLVCLAPGPKYELALGPLRNKIKAVLPHWFDECSKLRRYIKEDPFLFPNPTFLYPSGINDQTTPSKLTGKSTSSNSNEISTAELMHMENYLSAGSNSLKDEIAISPVAAVDKNKEVLNRKPHNDSYLQFENILGKQLVHQMPDLEQLKKLTPKDTYFQGHVIYIHPDIFIKSDIHNYLFDYLSKAGAETTNNLKDDVTIAIMKDRSSQEYRKIYKSNIMIASVFWLTNTLYRECLLPPLSTIWDYPTPRGGIVGMENMLITVSGYVSEPRTLLYRLCVMVGAKWTPNLVGGTTHLICSKKESEKYKAAKARNCVIVNHLWLEECYQQWTCKSVADSRYTYFPENDILQSLVGKTPLLEKEIERWGSVETLPEMTPYISAHDLYEISQNEDKNKKSSSSKNLNKGKLAIRGLRQAALTASSHIRDVLVPDMNQYNDEEKKLNANNKRQRLSMPTTFNDTNTTNKRIKLPPAPTLDSTISISNDAPLKTTEVKEAEYEDLVGQKIVTNDDSQETLNNLRDINSNKQIDSLTVQPPNKIAFSGGVVLTTAEQKSVKRLGCTITENIREASHLVVPDKIIRTPKFLCALNLGIIIVTFDWVKQSIKQKSWCNSLEYILNDLVTEDQYGFSLYQSLLTAQRCLVGVDDQGGKKDAHGTWLQGYDVCVFHSDKNSVFKEVVETAGGRWVTLKKHKLFSEPSYNLILLANKNDSKKSWSDYTKNNIRVYNTDAIVIGTFHQKLELNDYIIA
ncbi:unnamed protein product [Cunninghamella blakesleeana]